METPSTDQLQGFWKSRIVKYELVDPRTLVPNPDNFKIHPESQKEIMGDVLDEIGWVQNTIVNINTGHIIDGHMRIEDAIAHDEPLVPVTWIDVHEEEEAKIIAMFDPIAQYSKQNRDAVLAVIKKISTGSKRIQDVINRIAARSKVPVSRFTRDEEDDEGEENEFEDFEGTISTENYKLVFGDCLDVLSTMEDQSVDSIITDLPYNVTQAEWDSIIPLEDMWKQVLRVAKQDTMIVLFSAQPFTTLLIGSNHLQFKYEIIWVKNIPTGFLNSKIRPMSIHENICVFANGAMWYIPQMVKGEEHKIGGNSSSRIYGKYDAIDQQTTDLYYPSDVVYYDKGRDGTEHPSEKPVDLMKYLIRTFSRSGETVLDFTMGSGTTGVAAIECGRKFIGIENNKKFFDIAVERIEKANVSNE